MGPVGRLGSDGGGTSLQHLGKILTLLPSSLALHWAALIYTSYFAVTNPSSLIVVSGA